MSEYPLAIQIRGHARERMINGNRTNLSGRTIKQLFEDGRAVFCWNDGVSEYWLVYDHERRRFLAVVLETESNMRLRGGTSRKVITVHPDQRADSEQKRHAKELALENQTA